VFGALGVFKGAGAVPLELLLVIIVLSVCGGLTVVIDRAVYHGPGRWLRITAAALLLWLAVLGLGLIMGPACFGLLFAIAAASPPAIRRYGAALGLHPAIQRGTEQLCLDWQTSYAALQRAGSPSTRMRIIAARQRCLDELERRDPDGFSDWIASTAHTTGNAAHRFIPSERFNRGSR